MKKLAILIATLLIVCLMACACGKVEEPAPTPDAPTSEAPTSEAPTSEAPTSQAPTSQAPTSQAPTSQAPVTPTPTPGAGNELNLSDAAAIAANTYFTLSADLIDKTSSGKTAKDGWLNGTSFTAYKQAGKVTTPAYGVKGISFTTSGPATVYVYATRGSSGVVSGDLVLVDQSNAVLATVNPVEALACYTFTISAAGSYHVGCGSQASSINIFAIKVA